MPRYLRTESDDPKAAPASPNRVFITIDVNGQLMTFTGEEIMAALTRHRAALAGLPLPAILRQRHAYQENVRARPFTPESIDELVAMLMAVMSTLAGASHVPIYVPRDG